MTIRSENGATSRTLRVGIGGYGLAGKVFHAPLLVSAGFEVAAILTTHDERIASARNDFPEAKITSTINELVSEDLDLVVIASANSVHLSQALAAINAGVSVVVDKPLGLNLAEVEQLAQRSKQSGVGVIPFFNRLWDSDALTIKQVLNEGLLGEVFRLDSRFERFRPGRTPRNWREASSAAEGGGLLLDLQPHLISTALDWFGPATLGYSSVREVRKMSDDDVVVVLNHESGVDSYLAASAIIGAPGPRIRLSGTEGTLLVTELDGQEAALRDGLMPGAQGWNPPIASRVTIHRGDEITEYPAVGGDYGYFYRAVADVLVNGGSWPVSMESALSVTGLLDEARIKNIRA